MKANEFVKNYGLDRAKQFLDLPSYSIDELLMLQSGLVVKDLQRIVESYELVEKYKGSRGIRFRIRWGMFRYSDTQEFNNRLKQAIADVESCMEAASESN